MTLLKKIHSFLALLILIVSVPTWGIVVMLLGATRKEKLISWSIRSWNRFVLKIFAVKVRIHGLYHYDPQRSCLVVSNHQSLMDIPTLIGTLEGDLRMVAKKELFSIPFFGWAMTACGCISLDRGNQRSGREVSETINRKIRSGLQIWVAPEGTRSPDGQVQDFKKGSFAVAIDAQVPVQPIAISGAIDVLNRKHWIPQSYKTIDLSFCPPIDCAGLSTNDRGELALRTRHAIIDEMARIERQKESANG